MANVYTSKDVPVLTRAYLDAAGPPIKTNRYLTSTFSILLHLLTAGLLTLPAYQNYGMLLSYMLLTTTALLGLIFPAILIMAAIGLSKQLEDRSTRGKGLQSWLEMQLRSNALTQVLSCVSYLSILGLTLTLTQHGHVFMAFFYASTHVGMCITQLFWTRFNIEFAKKLTGKDLELLTPPDPATVATKASNQAPTMPLERLTPEEADQLLREARR
jgi:hypothetical protein